MIERTSHEKALQESEQFLKSLYKHSLRFLVPLTQQETYPIVCQAAMKLFDAQYASMFIKKGRALERVWDSSERMFRVKADKRGYAAKVVRTRIPSSISYSDLSKLHPNVVDWGVKSVTFIPLFYKNISMGYIALDSIREKRLTVRQKNNLRLFGSMAMIAIRKAQLSDEAQDALKNRDLFISLASHELRSPLTTINSYSQLIERELMLNKMPDLKWSKVLSAETQRLMHMVNELLQLNTIKSGKLHYVWKMCDLKEIIKRARVNFRAKHGRERLVYRDLLHDEEAIVLADFEKLMQVFLNVLNNAAKFSKDQIELRLAKGRNNFKICIEDRGVGISAKDQAKIFEGFYKGNNATKAGIGLGLYLSKIIMEMHQGKIEVESALGKGTTMIISIPQKNKNSTTHGKGYPELSN